MPSSHEKLSPANVSGLPWVVCEAVIESGVEPEPSFLGPSVCALH